MTVRAAQTILSVPHTRNPRKVARPPRCVDARRRIKPRFVSMLTVSWVIRWTSSTPTLPVLLSHNAVDSRHSIARPSRNPLIVRRCRTTTPSCSERIHCRVRPTPIVPRTHMATGVVSHRRDASAPLNIRRRIARTSTASSTTPVPTRWLTTMPCWQVLVHPTKAPSTVRACWRWSTVPPRRPSITRGSWGWDRIGVSVFLPRRLRHPVMPIKRARRSTTRIRQPRSVCVAPCGMRPSVQISRVLVDRWCGWMHAMSHSHVRVRRPQRLRQQQQHCPPQRRPRRQPTQRTTMQRAWPVW